MIGSLYSLPVGKSIVKLYKFRPAAAWDPVEPAFKRTESGRIGPNSANLLEKVKKTFQELTFSLSHGKLTKVFLIARGGDLRRQAARFESEKQIAGDTADRS
jgi:hypothetical protein